MADYPSEYRAWRQIGRILLGQLLERDHGIFTRVLVAASNVHQTYREVAVTNLYDVTFPFLKWHYHRHWQDDTWRLAGRG